jgi:hypothetical protein
MLLTIFTTHNPATDLGYLLHKHPERFQSYDLSFGRAHVFYPQATPDACTACLLLEVERRGIDGAAESATVLRSRRSQQRRLDPL